MTAMPSRWAPRRRPIGAIEESFESYRVADSDDEASAFSVGDQERPR